LVNDDARRHGASFRKYLSLSVETLVGEQTCWVLRFLDHEEELSSGRGEGRVISMRSSSSKVAFFLLVVPLGLFNAGCSTPGIGAAGLHDVAAGNWDRARIEFNRDFQDKPEHPIAVFNLGVTHQHDGMTGQAYMLFSEAAVRGKGYVPDETLEPPNAGLTVAEHACARLHRDNRLDANCGDQIALEAPVPPPPPIAEAAPEPPPPPAVEAPPARLLLRKQDRN